ncbi:uncharacterized protein LOC132048739 [Lycium ferocissimum]|uniref:uncharacterized protein LOC132048739 n=1 Tax=Lycium ferocissimum TaxID=112874 RepID=UPI0028154519|nr:uncharacterized protein LOC132048739 [Lycium ferocissimum]
MDFITCLDDYGLVDAGYSGNIFTWTNGRKRANRICKRLDRELYNEEWNNIMGITLVKHKAKTGSDHNLILLTCKDLSNNFIKYFRFLNFWTLQPSFLQVVQSSGEEEVQGNSMWILQEKLKKLSKKLSQWYKDTIGDVFQQVKNYEELVLDKEHKMDNDDSEVNR